MSITTRTGDQGTTGLMHGRRVSKNHPRVQACGAVDELNAALGIARAAATHAWVKEQVLLIQKDLIVFMGELAVAEEDCLRHEKNGSRVNKEMLTRLDEGVTHLEEKIAKFHGWSIPGETLPASFLDLARTICRRAEREIVSLSESQSQTSVSSLAIPYFNRLSDLLWLMARLEENEI